MRTLVTSVCLVVSFFGAAADARADGIFDTLGEPGTTSWDTACTGTTSGTTEEPWIDDPAWECSIATLPDCMHRVDIDDGVFPQAVCNDGSPGAFYVRPGAAGNNGWVIHLMGGAACMTHGECLDRWCGDNDLYTAAMMSTDWNQDGTPDIPDNILLGGMRLAGAANDFADYNHVYVYYCSSDGWIGQADDVTFTDGASSFEMDVQGHTILSVVRRMLRKIGPTAGWTAVDGSTLPDLDAATEIFFTGSSAGGFGALMNADWFLTPFPDADVALVVDAALEPSDELLDQLDVWVDSDDDGTADIDATTHRIQTAVDRWDVGGYFDEIDGFADESCRAEFEPSLEMDRCTITSELLEAEALGVPAISTPTFVRTDLRDPVLLAGWTELAAVSGGIAGSPMTPAEYGTMIRETLLDLHAAGDPVTGAFGPRCDRHVGLELTVAMGVDVTPTVVFFGPFPFPLGNALPLHDVLVQWFNGGSITSIQRVDNGAGGGFSTCG